VVEFLSDAWIARLDAAARAADGVDADPPFSVETLVHAPDGDTGYRVHFGADGASVTLPGVGEADVVLATDPETAWALHQGTVRAQEAFAQGALKLRGRPELLAGNTELLAALERAFAPVRADTTRLGRTAPTSPLDDR
jgi:hypothetical protein